MPSTKGPTACISICFYKRALEQPSESTVEVPAWKQYSARTGCCPSECSLWNGQKPVLCSRGGRTQQWGWASPTTTTKNPPGALCFLDTPPQAAELRGLEPHRRHTFHQGQSIFHLNKDRHDLRIVLLVTRDQQERGAVVSAGCLTHHGENGLPSYMGQAGNLSWCR